MYFILWRQSREGELIKAILQRKHAELSFQNNQVVLLMMCTSNITFTERDYYGSSREPLLFVDFTEYRPR